MAVIAVEGQRIARLLRLGVAHKKLGLKPLDQILALRVQNGGFGGEAGVHSRQHFRARAEGDIEGRALKAQACEFRLGLKSLTLGQEFARIGVLEGIDRLLLVPDAEHGAPQRVRMAGFIGAIACEEFLGQRIDDRPLFGRGVLGFIDQYMIKALVELVERPAARF